MPYVASALLVSGYSEHVSSSEREARSEVTQLRHLVSHVKDIVVFVTRSAKIEPCELPHVAAKMHMTGHVPMPEIMTDEG